MFNILEIVLSQIRVLWTFSTFVEPVAFCSALKQLSKIERSENACPRSSANW